MNKKHLRLLLFTLFLCSLFILSGCQQNAAVMAQRDAYISYLEEAEDDFATVHAMVNDKDLELGDDKEAEETSTEVQLQEFQNVLTKVKDYKSKIDERIGLIGKRDTQKNAELEAFAKSELRCLQLSSEVLEEFGQICNYALAISDVGVQLDSINSLDFTDMQNLEATYKAFSETIKNAKEGLEKSDTPSFFKSANDDMIEVLQELQDSTVYNLNAVIINDPVRQDAGAYRFNQLLVRKMSKVLADYDADVERRIAKLKEDVNQIKKLDSGLTDWIQKNLKALGAL